MLLVLQHQQQLSFALRKDASTALPSHQWLVIEQQQQQQQFNSDGRQLQQSKQ